MRDNFRALLAAGLMTLTLGGCGLARAEFEESGGAVGHLGDRVLPGATKELQLYRAASAFALFSSVGSRLASDPDQIFATLRYMAAVRNDLNLLAGHLWEGKTAEGETGRPCRDLKQLLGCIGYRGTFEADLPVMEGNLYKLAVSALPVQALNKVFKDLVAQNWLGAATGLLSPAEELLGGVHYGAAAWRAERELFAQLIARGNSSVTPSDTVQGAVEVIRTLDTDGKPDSTKYALALGPVMDQQVFDPLYWMVRQSCRRMLGRLSEEDVKLHMAFVDSKPAGGQMTMDQQREKICRSFKLTPILKE